jgi:hypothetical protein
MVIGEAYWKNLSFKLPKSLVERELDIDILTAIIVAVTGLLASATALLRELRKWRASNSKVKILGSADD